MDSDERGVDLENLRRARQEVSKKVDQLNEFSIRVGFLFVGAIIAAPLNLLLRPITYQNGNLRYGPAILLSSASWWVIPLFSFLLLVFLIFIILISYTVLIGLMGHEDATITYDVTNEDDFISEFTDYVIEQGDSLGMNVEYRKARNQSRSFEFLGLKIGSRSNQKDVLKCTDPYRELAHSVAVVVGPTGSWLNLILEYFYPKKVTEFEFSRDKNKIHIRFDPNNEKCDSLLDKTVDEFGKSVEHTSNQ
jgi:hypothetical protein